MIKHIALALTLAVAPLSTFAAQFIEGKHYTQISDRVAPTEPKVTEYFSFYCHNCLNMETQYLPFIKTQLDSKVAFENKHVDYMNNDLGTEVMRSLVVINTLPEKKHDLTLAMFGAIQGDGHDHSHGAHDHKHKSEINSRDDIKKVFAQHGIDSAAYDKIADSEQTDKTLSQWRQEQVMYGVSSVPSFVVNDKYMINMNEMRSLEQISELMNYLALQK
ncbi:thiol:disulfide interchange protein DsbA/DsbL [Shewanella intestini]|uniref:Thiol:disulfide interchange protein n=1 Tax=Shewanella intestini TaxID=2017544 RepID=A0ABS5I626_9GAMM|nr:MULTISPECIES: thiol:disulfide interchange protein DsbA/DsbL [Shewanella]MBR9729462.1 thiol:disulfide interchange protein DsbA/DsbL [Shewanella intestini]MRG35077.1 thioredoxin domain-containing protein [Shewanella sp. XMDDZSB0408]